VKAHSSTSNSDISGSSWIRASLFAFSAASVVLLIGGVMSFAYHSDATSKWRGSARQYELVVVGSSQAQFGYNPLVMKELTGYETYNLGGAGLSPRSCYYLLLDFLSEQKPKIVILDVYWRVLDGGEDLTQLLRAYERTENKEVKKQFFDEGFPTGQKIEYLIPILKYRANIHRDLLLLLERILDGSPKTAVSKTAVSKTAGVASAVSIDYHGHSHSHSIVSEAERTSMNKFRATPRAQFNPEKLDYLKKTVDLCREKGITVYVSAAPILPESLAFVPDYPEVHAKLETFFAKQGIEYLDYNLLNRDLSLVDSRHFTDENHMNGSGADIYTANLAGRLFPR